MQKLLGLQAHARLNAGRRKPRPTLKSYQASQALDEYLFSLNNPSEDSSQEPVSLAQLAQALNITKQGVKYRIDRFKNNLKD